MSDLPDEMLDNLDSMARGYGAIGATAHMTRILVAHIRDLRARLATEAHASEQYAVARDQMRDDRNEWKEECARLRTTVAAMSAVVEAAEKLVEAEGALGEFKIEDDKMRLRKHERRGRAAIEMRAAIDHYRATKKEPSK